jgi:alkylation response protein AidB-like acyl-CoA dehydrogenase
LEIGRINIAARSVGIAKRALRKRSPTRRPERPWASPSCQHQAIQLKLGEMGAKTRAAELLVEDAARAYDTGAAHRHGSGHGEVFRLRNRC